jgi:hypothetical protein
MKGDTLAWPQAQSHKLGRKQASYAVYILRISCDAVARCQEVWTTSTGFKQSAKRRVQGGEKVSFLRNQDYLELA